MAQSLSVTDVLNLIDAGFVSANELFQAYELILKYLSAGASMDVNDSKRFFKLAMIVYHGEKKEVERRKANTSIGSSEVPSTSKDIQQGGTLNLTSVRKESPKQTAKYFRILSEQERLIKKFGVTSRSVTLKFNNPNIEQGPIEWLKHLKMYYTCSYCNDQFVWEDISAHACFVNNVEGNIVVEDNVVSLEGVTADDKVPSLKKSTPIESDDSRTEWSQTAVLLLIDQYRENREQLQKNAIFG
ncbi:hypothetical protein RN001_002175 [Aquatica leii]|uniref:Uncharacterized protein n=1 Tax=Aquatica leii TaxID=1421715 RepID=A0AAN7Q4Y4_9COLE|nr:hypothetical protein RN001_002175 [Aquatica leii]